LTKLHENKPIIQLNYTTHLKLATQLALLDHNLYSPLDYNKVQQLGASVVENGGWQEAHFRPHRDNES